MKFGQVAAAILMFKLLELAWNYAWLRMPNGFDWQVLLIITGAWLLVSFVLWSIFTWLGRLAIGIDVPDTIPSIPPPPPNEWRRND